MERYLLFPMVIAVIAFAIVVYVKIDDGMCKKRKREQRSIQLISDEEEDHIVHNTADEVYERDCIF